MSKGYISIQEASDISGKSIQTIRRAIKSKKLRNRRQKTPQGFNYLVEKTSLCEIYKLNLEPKVHAPKAIPKAQKTSVPKSREVVQESVVISSEDFSNFAATLEKMMTQHSEERQNFLRLVNTLQEKIFVLENQLSLIQAPKKKWFELWK